MQVTARFFARSLSILGFSALTILTSTLLPNTARAQDSSSTRSVGSSGNGSSSAHLPEVLHDKKFEANSEITDPKLRADSGSLSRYSVKLNVNYQGPTINDFSNTDQPNPDHLLGAHKVYMGGSIATRYRIDRDSAMNFGTGLKALTPFSSVNRVDVADPYLSYDVTKKLGGFQTRISPGVKIITAPENRNAGEYGAPGVEEGVVYNLGMSRWALSMDGSENYNLYNRDYRPKTKSDRNASQADLSFYPGVKYLLSDNLNIATSVAVGFYNPREANNLATLQRKTIGERLGIGWAIKRDIYLYPYVTFYPTALEVNTTSFNFSTIISVL